MATHVRTLPQGGNVVLTSTATPAATKLLQLADETDG